MFSWLFLKTCRVAATKAVAAAAAAAVAAAVAAMVAAVVVAAVMMAAVVVVAAVAVAVVRAETSRIGGRSRDYCSTTTWSTKSRYSKQRIGFCCTGGGSWLVAEDALQGKRLPHGGEESRPFGGRSYPLAVPQNPFAHVCVYHAMQQHCVLVVPKSSKKKAASSLLRIA